MRERAHDEPCTVCGGRVVTVPDPDIKHRAMTYCKDCATQYAGGRGPAPLSETNGKE